MKRSAIATQFSKSSRWFTWFGAVLLVCLLSACASPVPTDSATPVNTPNQVRVKPSIQITLPRDEIRTIVQVCLPDERVSFEDVEVDLTGIPNVKTMRDARAANGYLETGDIRITAPMTEPQVDPDRVTVRRWIPGSGTGQVQRSLGFGHVTNQDGILGAGGSQIYLWSNSEKNQPIYEKQEHRPKDMIALRVSIEVNSEFVDYWYKQPREIPMARFSDWQEPISQETKKDRESGNPTWWNLTHGREMKIHPVTGNAPKIRYRLMTVEEYYDQYRFWERSNKAVGEKFYRGVGDEERKVLRFVPRLIGTIPGC